MAQANSTCQTVLIVISSRWDGPFQNVSTDPNIELNSSEGFPFMWTGGDQYDSNTHISQYSKWQRVYIYTVYVLIKTLSNDILFYFGILKLTSCRLVFFSGDLAFIPDHDGAHQQKEFAHLLWNWLFAKPLPRMVITQSLFSSHN